MERDKAEARLFASGYDIAVARALMDAVNGHVAARVRDLIPQIRQLSADARATAITDAASDACEEVLRLNGAV